MDLVRSVMLTTLLLLLLTLTLAKLSPSTSSASLQKLTRVSTYDVKANSAWCDVTYSCSNACVTGGSWNDFGLSGCAEDACAGSSLSFQEAAPKPSSALGQIELPSPIPCFETMFSLTESLLPKLTVAPVQMISTPPAPSSTIFEVHTNVLLASLRDHSYV